MTQKEHPLKVWRAENGVTLQALSDKTGLHTGSISLIESGKRGLSFTTIRKLSKATGIPPGDFIRDVRREPA